MFDRAYYERIWGHIGGVHRHDYCKDRARWLVSKYGQCSILDVGTGCGNLVLELRALGCDAWGLEISDYAIDNSCCPEYVRKGDAKNMPFASGFFDVVHSNGLFGYDADVQAVWRECKRVGRLQEHNIDADDDDPDHAYVVIKPRSWWDEQLAEPKILVACPTFDGKEYCFQKWIDNVKSLTYPNYEILSVDNSKTPDFFEKYSKQIPMRRLTFRPDEKDDAMYRVCQSMGEIQRAFIAGNFEWWMNIEADVIPPKDIIERLLKYSEGMSWVQHAYPTGVGDGQMQGIGCSLLSKRLMTDFPWSDPSVADDSPDAELWNWVLKKRKEGIFYPAAELWHAMTVEHLK